MVPRLLHRILRHRSEYAISLTPFPRSGGAPGGMRFAMTKMTKKPPRWQGGSRFVQEVGGARNEIDRRPQASSLLSFALSTTTSVRLNMAAIITALELKVNRRFDQRAAGFAR
jgi:hypothetical protein